MKRLIPAFTACLCVISFHTAKADTSDWDDRPGAQIGTASYYSADRTNMRTATGEKVDPEAFTAAHWTLPLGSWVKVTDLDNGRSVKVRINDRSAPNVERIIDLSQAAARMLGMMAAGLAEVRIEPTTKPEIAPLPPRKPDFKTAME